MRAAFISSLMKVAREDPNLWLLTADLGYSFLEGFAKAFPKRFVNVGVAEQNMVSLAAGLALCGKKVVIYSIINFATFRCLEQIRNDICYHQLDVTVVGVGAGYFYGAQGYSHHGIEDIAIMRALPCMKIFVPADAIQTSWITEQAMTLKGPSYLRLGRGGLQIEQDLSQGLGKGVLIRKGKDISLFALGEALEWAIEVADILKKHSVSVRVLSFPRVVPIDEEMVIQTALETQGTVIIEEHGIGGLSTIVAEIFMKKTIRKPVKVFNVLIEPIVSAGSFSELRRLAGLDVDNMVSEILREML